MKSEIIKATMLSASAKPYNFEGKSGISYKSSFLIGDKILSVKTNEEQYNEMKDLTSQVGQLVLQLDIYDNRLICRLDKFDWE